MSGRDLRGWTAEALVRFATGEAVTDQVDRQDAIGELLRRLYSQEKPCTEWGRGVDDRLEALEEEIEAGLSSLGEQVDLLERLVRRTFEQEAALGEAPDMGSMLDQEELLSSIDRHLEEAHAWRANACQAWDRQDKSTAEFDLRLAAVHADTARAQAALLEACR